MMSGTTDRLSERLARAHALLESPVFDRNSREDGAWKPAFIELITVVDELLNQSGQQGNRIDFLDSVGVGGKIQDITSLVQWMQGHLLDVSSDLPGQLAGNRLNRYFNRGTGYFANGSFFTVDFDDELGFFIDDQRIYLKHHIGRALHEAEVRSFGLAK